MPRLGTSSIGTNPDRNNDDALWGQLEADQNRRNKVVHEGITVEREYVQGALERVQAVVGYFGG